MGQAQYKELFIIWKWRIIGNFHIFDPKMLRGNISTVDIPVKHRRSCSTMANNCHLNGPNFSLVNMDIHSTCNWQKRCVLSLDGPSAHNDRDRLHKVNRKLLRAVMSAWLNHGYDAKYLEITVFYQTAHTCHFHQYRRSRNVSELFAYREFALLRWS